VVNISLTNRVGKWGDTHGQEEQEGKEGEEGEVKTSGLDGSGPRITAAVQAAAQLARQPAVQLARQPGGRKRDIQPICRRSMDACDVSRPGIRC
jgi:hypothetical protein